MIPRNRRPTTPGRLLLATYLEPNGISIARFAEACGLSRKHVSNIVNGHAAVSPETAIRFSEALGTTPDFWVNAQRTVDLFDARVKLKAWKPKERYGPGKSAA